MSMKNFKDTIGNRTRDLRTCSVVQFISYCRLFNQTTYGKRGHAVVQLVEALRYKPERSRVRFPMGVIGFLH